VELAEKNQSEVAAVVVAMMAAAVVASRQHSVQNGTG